MSKKEITTLINELYNVAKCIRITKKYINKLTAEHLEIMEILPHLEKLERFPKVAEFVEELQKRGEILPHHKKIEWQGLKSEQKEYYYILDQLNGVRLTKKHRDALEKIFKIIDN